MRKRISIAIVYNEPMIDLKSHRKYITENGTLRD